MGVHRDIGGEGYRPGVPGAPQYPVLHTMPVPQQSQIPQSYGNPYNPLATTRAPIPEGMQIQEAGLPSIPQPAMQDPLPRSCVEKGWRYELHVVQQPRRARMCGFGDKDRRPITPPPCVRLIITDVSTGKEVDCNDVDHGMFVLNVDLWSSDGQREVNLVRHSATSPSISCTTPVSYAQIDPTTSMAYSSILPTSNPIKFEGGHQQAPYNPYPGQPSVTPYAASQPQQYGGQPQYQGYAPPTNGAQQYPPQNGYSQTQPQPAYYTTGSGIHAIGQQGIDFPPPQQQLPSHSQYGARQFPGSEIPIHRVPVSSTAPQGMFTRNLIGSLAASAFRLTDPDDRIGIWFVLQDLSVRTEGNFRLRFSFVNVGVSASPTTSNGTPGTMTAVNTGKAPVLAACFSEVFTVYSAKRFPGVVESTPLSKCFATQGIKIPIRKDGPGKGDKEKDDDDF
ncbi:velvet factor-domain-containing protein [Hyaloscypha finlandica]|nr:velvet factor-domain-containing protein [Hyaloscypha finlandica]